MTSLPTAGKAELLASDLSSLLHELLLPFAREYGVSPSDALLARLAAFGAYLLDENQRMNLTASRSVRDLVCRHLADALPFLGAIGASAAIRIADIGSGAGLPGIPLAMFLAGSRVTLIESVQKKAAFLERARERLLLGNAEVVCARAEDLGRDARFRGRYDAVTVRACAALPVALEYGLPLLASGGVMLAAKGPAAAEEIASSKRALGLLGGQLAGVTDYRLPEIEATFRMVRIDKVGNTPGEYPRRSALMAKRPL